MAQPNVMETQRGEFDAMKELAEQYRRLTMTPIVDDDYPSVRHDWESALAGFIDAMKANGRFKASNRYRVYEGPQPASGVDVKPDDLLNLVRAAQYEVRLRRTIMGMSGTTPASRKEQADRIQVLREWLSGNGFNDGED